MNAAISLNTKQQICLILVSTERVINVQFVPVDGKNTLAFTTALYAGDDPQYLHFNTEGTSMWGPFTNVLQCLEDGVIQPSL